MADKPDLSILDGDAWEEALDQIETAQDAGHYFDFPRLEGYLDQGHAVEIFDRTNAVFQLSLYRGDPGERPEGTTVSYVPRAMFVAQGLAQLEEQLGTKGKKPLKGPQALTGAPEEQDGLENHLAYHSSSAYLSKHEGRFHLTLTGVDYQAMGQPGYDRDQPKPRYQHVFAGATIKEAYAQAAAFGKLDRDQRYQERGMTPPYMPEI